MQLGQATEPAPTALELIGIFLESGAKEEL